VFSLTVFSGLPRPKENNSYIFHFFRYRRTYASGGHLAFWELRVKVRCLQRNEKIYKARPGWDRREGRSKRAVAVETFTMIFFICHPYVSITMLSLEKSFARTSTLTLLQLSICTRFYFYFFLFFCHNSLMLTRNLLSHTQTHRP